ncbi:MAG: MotA/TolQ/ExbB proton channel family protein [Gammaproteobacteria bacterium]|nr:MAG: MotA/TolQ/ExbB proton channel family protein [Gammaproteobacteria bacterium]
MPDTASLSPSVFFDGPLGHLFEMGGPVMMVLAVIAVTGFATFIYLTLCGALYAPRLTGGLKKTVKLWQSSPADVAPAQVRKQAGTRGRMNPLLHLVADTIEAFQGGKDPSQIRETAARDAQHALEPFEAPLKIIEVIAALAPLLGLLGTVMGMMEAFSAMAATEGRANASQLSGGIYEALTTTAAGLVIAIPFAALAAWIEFRLRRIHKVMNSTLVTVFSGFDRRDNTGADVVAEPGESSATESEDGREPEGFQLPAKERFAHAAG